MPAPRPATANADIATGALPPLRPAPGTPLPAARPPAASGEMQLASLPPMQYAPDAPIPASRLATGAIELPKDTSKDSAKDATKSANLIFSTLTLPNASSPRSIGEYNKGCMSGAAALPLVGANWQVMRPSRNRNWGHPTLVDFIQRLAGRVAKTANWSGILIGDMSQPRGGPLPFGHASHQIGLDVDIWLKPMPKEPFADADREKEEAVSVLAADRKHVDPKIWLDGDAALVKLAAEEPQVERVFANAAIKQELCTNPQTKGASWLTKVRPWWGHDEHVHVRLKCQPGSASCKDQAPIPAGDGCGKALDSWFKPGVLAWRPPPDGTTLRKPMPMAALPAECTSVAKAPAGTNLARQ
jgi:penicillin-insensitive murein endopeptidase